MFWLLKKIFGLAVIAALVFFALQAKIGGRPLKEYVVGFYQSPIVQEGLRQAKDAATSYLQKDLQPASGPAADGVPLDRIHDDERRELEKVLNNAKQ